MQELFFVAMAEETKIMYTKLQLLLVVIKMASYAGDIFVVVRTIAVTFSVVIYSNLYLFC
jgi:hypothetical protein